MAVRLDGGGAQGRRGWGRIAVAILVMMSMVVSLARTAEAADDPPPTSYTISIPLPDGVDLARVRAEVADLNNRNPQLSDTFQQEAAHYPFRLQDGTFTVEQDFDGTLAVTGSILSLTIEADEVQANSLSWWQDVLLAAASGLAGLAVRIQCEGFFGLGTGGTGSVFAAAFCVAVGSALGTFIYQMVNIFADGAQQDGRRWGRAVGLAVVAALIGVAWEGGLNTWARTKLPGIMRNVGRWVKDTGRSLTGWARGAGSRLEQVGEAIDMNAGPFAESLADALEEGAATNSVNLRVLPLGDSITYGDGTPDSSSYRAQLWGLLLAGDVDRLDYVGSQKTGQLADRDNEGHQGWTISQISAIASCTMREYRPNVVTLHIGTNDMARNIDVAGAPERLRGLIRQILAAGPETTVLVSTLIPSTTPAIMNRIQQYNAAIPGIVAGFQAAGRAVYLVDMGAVTPGDMTDSLHPNANGYRKMAAAFDKTISTALRWGGFLTAKNGVPGACGTTPEDPSVAGMDGWNRFERFGGMIAAGVPGGTREELRFADIDGDGRDDYLLVDPRGRVRAWGNALPSVIWTPWGEVAAGVPGGTREELRFADLNGDGRDDYLLVSPEGRVRAWGNAFPSKIWTPWGEVAAGVPGGTREGLRFADIDGDGADDYLMVDPQGQVRAWGNKLPSKIWTELGVVAWGVGATQQEVRFTDIDGDSRDDYLVVNAQGKVRAWLNTIGQSGGGSWLVQGEIASGAGVSRENVEFADVDGDGNADYLTINAAGQVWAWLGERFAGPERWDPQGMIAAGVPGGTLEGLRFADLNGDGKADYLMVDPQGRVRAWGNKLPSVIWIEWGEVAAGVPGGTREELRFADLNGDGRDDYLLVSPEGRVRAWGNAFPSKIWTPWGEVAAGVPGGTREGLRFADIDGDGRDDYLMVGPQGQVRAWGNAFPSKIWTEWGEISSGIGLHDSMITFADIDGDGRDDYLSVNGRGRIWAWLNNRGSGGPDWLIQGEIATGVGVTRDQVFLEDVNGDRRFDYLVSTSAGAVTAWHGNGQVRKG
ncbi:FG-GAP-like repeat-containing protein [Acrocarpospora catenulata]|uniref:FG-GAP-like repeat-containing protein n=1 Tax=Acrocarpospora catenulata TaxID=2836182 RepID=UPI001BDB1169|nr:FG-GAP-like repeat-containing protein [Acrocarpospora catenulata]